MSEQKDTKIKDFPDERKEQLEKLQNQLSQRGNELISQDPFACKLLGAIEVLREQLGDKA